jgi:hypothetical protein
MRTPRAGRRSGVPYGVAEKRNAWHRIDAKTDLFVDMVSVQVAMPCEQGKRGEKLEMHGGCLSLTASGLSAFRQEPYENDSGFNEVRREDSS